jgi:NADH:ubiquinone oxidoreductase subunit E
MTINEPSIESITKRLDAIIRLLMEEQNQKGTLRRSDQFRILDSVGLTSAEISRIVSQPSKDVASAIGKLRKTP